ncbi:MAG: hypothetical protein ACJ8AW_40675 [Rhodopila sp.]
MLTTAMLTTAEFLCRHIHGAIASALGRGELGEGADALSSVRVTLTETHLAKAWYKAPLV